MNSLTQSDRIRQYCPLQRCAPNGKTTNLMFAFAFAFALAFSIHLCARSAETSGGASSETGDNTMAKVTGIGGVFIPSKNSKVLTEWYHKNLGVALEPWGGAVFKWGDDNADDGGATAWQAMDKGSEMFNPGHTSFVINYRIDDMDKMVKQLKANGVTILKGPESHENGKFLWLMDPDGNNVQLWEAKIWDDKNKKS